MIASPPNPDPNYRPKSLSEINKIDKRPMYTYYDVADLLMDHGYVPHPSSIGQVKNFLDKYDRLPDAIALEGMDLPTYEEHDK